MINNQDLYQYTQLAEAAYANFYKNGKLISSDEEIRKTLIASKMGEDSDGRDAQANQIVDNWSVKAYYVDRGEGDDWKTTQESGFSATLFQGKSGTANAGEYVLAMRGTAGSKDLVIADGTDIVVDGLAMYQLVDMYNFWNQIKAENGEPYLVATLEADEALTDLYQNADALQRLAMRNELSKQGYIIDYLNIGSNDSSAPPSSIFPNPGDPAANQPIFCIAKVNFKQSDTVYNDERAYGLGIDVNKVTVTGHSLGGHLSAGFSRLFPEATIDSLMVNGAGYADGLVDGLSTNGAYNIRNLFDALGGADKFDESKITNITGSAAIDFIAQDWLAFMRQPGSQPEIFTEDANLITLIPPAFGQNTVGHGSGQMTNTMAILDLFFRIDQSLAGGSLENALTACKPIFEAANHNVDFTLEQLVEGLAKLYLGQDAKPLAINDRPALYEQIALLQVKIPKSSSVKLEALAGKSVKELMILAKQNIGYRYALINGNDFALVGADYSQLNKNGELEMYNPTTGNGHITEEYIQARSDYLHLLLRYNQDKSSEPSALYADGLYVDRTTYNVFGPFDTTNGGMTPIDENTKTIIFGTEKNEDGKQKDEDGRILNIIDISDEGKGFAFGGKGHDTILMGGKGEDYAEGGVGFDTYDIRAGGNQTIRDIDGIGEVLFDSEHLGTANAINGSLWRDEDENIYQRVGNDLWIIKGQGEKGVVTIKEFFLQFKKVDGVTSGLGITLLDKGDPPVAAVAGLIRRAEGTASPLVLDFNGDGVSTTTLKDGVYFDLTNSGHAVKTAWVGRYDGVLALDINEDGTINHGGELFGNYTLLANGLRAPTGFHALEQYDKNKDGVIDEKDDIYSQLKVWFDTNFNGQSDKGELLSLIEAGVKSINLDYIWWGSYVDENGNDHRQQGSFTKMDGSVAQMNDVWFSYNHADTKDTLKLEKTAEIAALIEIAGFGTVHDLQNSMMLDESGTLKALVIEITAALRQGQSFASLREHIDTLIFEWSGAAGYSMNSRGAETDGRMMYALEAFYGKKYDQYGWGSTPGTYAAHDLGKAFSILEQYVLDSFIYEITVRPLLDQVDFTWNETTQQMNADVSKLVTGLKTEFDRAPQEFIYVLNVLRNKLVGHGDLGQQILQQIAQLGHGYTGVFEQLLTAVPTGLKIDTPALGSQTLHDIFLAKSGDDVIVMDPSMTQAYGYNGDDTIYASTNNSRMMGDYGSDTYVLFKGHGQDVIVEDGKTTDVDVLKFTDINFSEVSVKRVGNDLILFGYHGTDQITIENAYLGKQYGIETFIFADRTLNDQEIFLSAHLSAYFELITQNVQETGSHIDFTAVWARFAEDLATQDPTETILKFKEFLDFNHLNADVSQGTALLKNYVSQVTNAQVLVDLGQAFLVNLGLTQFEDVIFANSKGGNIVQESDQQPSTQLFLSGSGNDYFTNYNMTTSSTYRFSAGHGQDIIYDRSEDATRISTIEFTDVEKAAVLFKRTLDDLVLYGYRGSDQISIHSYFNNNDYSINQILFSDQIFNLNIKDKWLDPFYNTTYTVSKDWYSFWENTGGRNALSEGKGDKWINDDRGTNDTIIFKGIYAAGVRFSKSEDGNHLIISQNDKNLMIHNFFVGTQYRIETLIFEDKTLLLTDEVMATLFNDVYTVEKGFSRKDILDTNQGDDTLIFKGFNLGEMRFERSGNHLMIVGQQGTNAYGNTLYISNFYSNPDNRIETFIFDDKALSLKDGSIRLDNEWLTEFNNNIYTVKKGFGSQTIYDLNQGADTIIFKGYVASDIRIEREYDDLILITSDDGRLRVTNFYYSNAYRIEKLQFDDQLIEVTDAWLAPFFDTTYILEKGFEFKLIQEDAGNDTIILKGFKKSDVLFDRERYYTYYDNLLIRTKDGDLLKIYNFYMNDKNRIETIVFDDQTVTLTDEWLKTANNTTYLLEKNAHDFSTIIADQAGEDQLIFKGYLADELTFKRSLTDYYTLEVTNSQGEILRIENFFYYTGRIESFVFDDRVIQTDYEWELSLENNQYHFAEGFGTHVINDYAGTDSITLTGISFVDATFKRSGEDLILNTLAGDSLILSGFFSNTTYYGTSNFAFIQFDDQRFELTKDWIADFSNTTYLYDKNTGSFGGYIYDTKGDDTMIFKGYQSGELTFKRDANDPDALMIINQQGERIVIQSFFYTPPGIDVPPPNGGDEVAPPPPSSLDYQIERFVFDNQTISLAQILEKLNTPSEVIFSKEDIKDSYNPGDIVGTDGNDTLTGTTGNNVIYGLGGNDRMVGDEGNDTYIFAKGHGNDVIYDYGYSSATETDTLIFTDVRSSEVKFGRNGDNLILFGYNRSDQITIEKFFASTRYSYAIEVFKFVDKTITYDEFKANGLPLYALDETSDITGWEGANIIHAGSGTKNITTGDANNVIYTESASGTVTGGNGQDTFYSGTGNTHLVGDEGNDTYVFAKGHGQDVIYDYGYSSATETDTLIFTDVRSSEVKFGRSGDNLILFGYNGADKITIEQFFTSTQYSYAIEIFQFTDKTITYDEYMAQGLPLYALDETSDITGWEGVNIIHAGSGTKNITTGNANNVINTESASGTVTGGNSQDTFYSGSGNSRLVGGNGSDTYIFAKGHGQDVIYDYGYSSATETDTLIFTDVKSSEVKFGRSGDDLILFGYNGADKITIEQFFTSTQYSYAIEVFQFADKVITYDELIKTSIPAFTAEDQASLLAAQAELDVARTLSQVMSPASYLMNDELFGNNGSGDTLSSFSTTQNNQTQADIAKEVQSLISAMASFGATDGGSIQVEDQTYGYLSAITVPN